MEAKDTVMTYKQARAVDYETEKQYKKLKDYKGFNWAYTDEDRRTLESNMEWDKLKAQAEISFKAGEDKGYSKGFEAGIVHSFPIGEKAGIKEVVEWIKSHSSLEQGKDEEGRLSWFVRDEWQAKLKEWGIE